MLCDDKLEAGKFGKGLPMRPPMRSFSESTLKLDRVQPPLVERLRRASSRLLEEYTSKPACRHSDAESLTTTTARLAALSASDTRIDELVQWPSPADGAFADAARRRQQHLEQQQRRRRRRQLPGVRTSSSSSLLLSSSSTTALFSSTAANATMQWTWWKLPGQLLWLAAAGIIDGLKRLDVDVLAALAGLVLVAHLVVLHYWAVELQTASFGVTMWLRRLLDERLGEHTAAVTETLSHFLHHNLSTGNWLLACLCLFWWRQGGGDETRWARLYSFVSVSFVVKSLAKSYLQSPRGFWLWTAGHSKYCGTGYSLPSGHAMISVSAMGYLCWALQSPALLLAALLVELLTFFNVIYIGTHTFLDVLIGWSSGLFCLAVWLKCERLAKRSRSSSTSSRDSRAQWLVRVALAFCLALVGDHLDTYCHPPHPSVYQANMERFCMLEPGTGAKRMSLLLNYSNTPLVTGVAVAYALFARHLGARGVRVPPYATWQRLLLCLLGVVVFVNLHPACAALAASLGRPELARHAHNFLSPVLSLFAVPWLARSLFDTVARFMPASKPAKRSRSEARFRDPVHALSALRSHLDRRPSAHLEYVLSELEQARQCSLLLEGRAR